MSLVCLCIIYVHTCIQILKHYIFWAARWLQWMQYSWFIMLKISGQVFMMLTGWGKRVLTDLWVVQIPVKLETLCIPATWSSVHSSCLCVISETVCMSGCVEREWLCCQSLTLPQEMVPDCQATRSVWIREPHLLHSISQSKRHDVSFLQQLKILLAFQLPSHLPPPHPPPPPLSALSTHLPTPPPPPHTHTHTHYPITAKVDINWYIYTWRQAALYKWTLTLAWHIVSLLCSNILWLWYCTLIERLLIDLLLCLFWECRFKKGLELKKKFVFVLICVCVSWAFCCCLCMCVLSFCTPPPPHTHTQTPLHSEIVLCVVDRTSKFNT